MANTFFGDTLYNPKKTFVKTIYISAQYSREKVMIRFYVVNETYSEITLHCVYKS